MIKQLSITTVILIALNTCSAMAASKNEQEPTVFLPIQYVYENDNTPFLRNALLPVPASKALEEGMVHGSPEITEAALNNRGLEHIDSENLHRATTSLLNNRLGQKITKYFLHGLMGLCELSIIIAIADANRHDISVPGTFALATPFVVALHALINKGCNSSIKRYDDIIRLMLQHKAFSNPKHAAINKLLQRKLLEHFDKKQLKALTGSADAAATDAAHLEQ